MTTQTITLTNEFHNTSVNVRATVDSTGRVTLTKSQVDRAHRTLCGIGGCTCGDVAGCRPMQVFEYAQGRYEIAQH